MRASFGLLVFLATTGWANAQPVTPTLTLSASATRPYVNQQVRLTLAIELPDGFPTNDPTLELHIPWLKSEFGFQWFQPSDEWLRARQQATGGLQVRLAGLSVRADEAVAADGKKSRRFELHWRLAVNEPDELSRGGIAFAAVRLTHAGGAVASNRVSLQVRNVLLPPPDLPRLYLGVGDWQMDTEISSTPFGLGDRSRLTLRVHGSGDLARIRRPLPAQLWPADRVRIEPGPEVIEGNARLFHYTLHPRTAGPLTLPSIAYACFDPERGVYLRREMATVTVGARTQRDPRTASQRPYPDKVPERLGAIRLHSSSLAYEPAGLPWAPVLGVLLLPMIPWLILWSLRYRLWPHAWPLRARPSRASAHLALHVLERPREPLDAELIHELLLRYLTDRLGWHAVEPASAEVEAALRAAKLDNALVRATRELVELLNEARFGEQGVSVANLVGRTQHVITSLEAAP